MAARISRPLLTTVVAVLALSGCSGDGPADPSSATTSGGAAGTASSTPTAPAGKLVAAPPVTAVSHLFYHCLVVDPKRAFASSHRTEYQQYMVTVREFRAQLEQLHAHGYVLVHPERLVSFDAHGNPVRRRLMLPEGKKPLVLSIDDVSYYTYMNGTGFASDLFLDAAGRLANHYTTAAGKTVTGSYDVAPMIDDFVRKHPDFSYEGDKGSVALTGYNGILGYRSSVREYGDTAATRTARKRAAAVASGMKKQGWNFASHSWGHIDFTRSPLAKIETDSSRWNAEVRPLVGSTTEFVYPFGADIAGRAPYSSANPKYAFLHEKEKYRYFFPIDARVPAHGQLAAGSLRQYRINVDGISIERAIRRGHRDPLWRFFDPKATVDPARGDDVSGTGAAH